MRVNSGVRLTVPGADRLFDMLRAGQIYGRGSGLGPTAANYSHVQLFNPAGSNVNAIVSFVSFSSNTNTGVRFSIYNTACTTLVGTGYNLLSGGAAAACVIRTEDNAAELGTFFDTITIPANETLPLTVPWQLEIGPGEGFVLNPTATNRSLTASFRWAEIAI